jgi:hypothetical protein
VELGKEVIGHFEPHVQAEKKHSRRFKCVTEDFPVRDIYVMRPECNNIKRLKMTLEVEKYA